jgi:hypothetical protein
MLKFLLGIILGLASLTGLIFLLRLLLDLQSKADRYFTRKYPRTSKGFRWGIKVPTKAGEILQFYFYSLMGKKHYMNYSSWPVKIALLITVFLFIAVLTANRFTNDFYTFRLTHPEGLNPYLHGGTVLWYLHMVNLAYLGLLVLVSVDSVRMMGWFAPLRIGLNVVTMGVSIMASLISFGLLVAISFLYIAYKLLMLFFVKKENRSRDREPGLISRYYYRFLEVKNQFDSPDIVNTHNHKTRIEVDPRLEYYDKDIRKLRRG